MKRILIVDDIEDYLRSLKNALKNEFEVTTARSLVEAKETMNDAVKVVLADIRLDEENPSNKDGLLFLEWTKMNHPGVPVIIMSAYTEFDMAVEALNLGASYFLKKPINLVELKGLLNNLSEKEN